MPCQADPSPGWKEHSSAPAKNVVDAAERAAPKCHAKQIPAQTGRSKAQHLHTMLQEDSNKLGLQIRESNHSYVGVLISQQQGIDFGLRACHKCVRLTAPPHVGSKEALFDADRDPCGCAHRSTSCKYNQHTIHDSLTLIIPFCTQHQYTLPLGCKHSDLDRD